MDRRMMLAGLGAGAIASVMSGFEMEGQTGGGVGPVYELRVYHAAERKLDPLLARFRDHTITIFARHNIKLVGFFTPTDPPLKGEMLVYILQHPDRAQAEANWKAFHDDPEWIQVSKDSEKDGKLVEKVDSLFLVRTSFSPAI